VALLREPSVREHVTFGVGTVADGLTPGDLAAVLVESAEHIEPTLLVDLASRVPAPWPASVADAVLAAARKLGAEPYPDQAYYALVRAASVGGASDRADDLVTVAMKGGEVRPALVGAVETIRLRARIHDAFAALPAPPATMESP
jgi:hypothetical protein